MRTENREFLTYIAKYLGVALIAGSVVHIGTLDNGTMRYFILALVGLALMLSGNIIETIQANKKINAKYFANIVGLSFATGFLSGGVQHYLDNPYYASYLLGIGLLIAYLTFFWKESLLVTRKSLLVVVVISLALLFSHHLFNENMGFFHIDLNAGEHGH